MSDLILSRNGRKARGPETHNVTRAEAEQIALQAAQQMCVAVCEHYMSQVPGKVAEMIVEFFKAQGLEVKPPVVPDIVPGDVQ